MRDGFDAIVVGAGAGGAAAAWRLTQRGMRVLVLEAGPWFDPARDYGLDKPDWESRPFPEKAGSQGRYRYAALQPLDPQWDDLRSWHHEIGPLVQTGRREVRGGYSHVRGVGGSTLHFVGEAHRLHPRAMRMGSEHGVAADWPFGYDELEPYYVEVEHQIGVAGPSDPQDVRWRSKPYAQPPHAASPSSRLLMEAGASLGQRWALNPRAALTKAMDGRPPCNRCGGCSRGCPRRDKGSADQTFIPHAIATRRCEVRARCTVLGLVHGDRKVVQGVRYADERGRMRTERAGLVVLAAGAVETPRFLLNQRHRLYPHGLGNDHGHVGRHFMETISWVSLALHPEPLASFGGLPSDAICWDFNAPDAIPGVKGGMRLTAATIETGLQGPVSYGTRAVPGWGKAFKQALREAVGRAVAVGAVGESLPHAGSRIELAPDDRDAYGMPLARIHSHLDDMACRRLQFMAQHCRAVLKAAGCGPLVQEVGSYDSFSATHVFGTCRMSETAQQGVCNDVAQIHGWGNLLICDASTFPSSGGGESPSLTIQACALRAVDRFLSAV